MYKVIGSSTNRTFRVLWLLEELEVDYERISASPGSDEARAHNPSGKVPTLETECATITDSCAILSYLSDKHQALTATPGTIERARQDSILHLILDEIDSLLWAAARHSFILPSDRRVPEIKPVLRWEFSRNIKNVEARLTDQFIAGEQFTIADIVLTHCLNWAQSARFEYDSALLTDYAARICARPAFQRVAALSR